MKVKSPGAAESVGRQLPLRPVELHILLALAKDEMHGYRIMLDTLERSGGAIRLEQGTLYRGLRRLLDAGVVAESKRRPASGSDDERRRYYRITELGRAVAEAEAQRLADLVQMARDRDLVTDGETA